MHKIIFAGAILLSSLAGSAQRATTCGYIIPPKSLKTQFSSVYEAKDIVNSMLTNLRWEENFNLRVQNGIQNAYATIIQGRRFIVYDNNFLEDIDAYSKTKWASISIMAHEVGHHYYNHVVNGRGNPIQLELEADAFSGYIIQKLGGTVEQALAAMNAIGTPNASNTHPAKRDRLAAINRGFATARTGNSPTNANTTPAPVPQTPPTPQQQNTGGQDASWIALYIQSDKDEVVELSDDGKNYQRAEIKEGEPFVFKFEIYEHGWIRLPYYNGYRRFKLMHGKDYYIVYNRRTKNRTVVEVPD